MMCPKYTSSAPSSLFAQLVGCSSPYGLSAGAHAELLEQSLRVSDAPPRSCYKPDVVVVDRDKFIQSK